VSVTRRLAAILAADVVGYSRLLEQDEVGTLAALKARRKGVLEPLVAQHHGRIVKVMGDGVLVEFGSAVNAVTCAVELQKRMAKANDGIFDDRQVTLRIGINLGDVVVEGGDLYGDGVIIAVRLQGMAEPSEVYVSQTVHDHVRNKVELKFEDLGEQTIKNISASVRVYRVAGTGVAAKADARNLPLPSKPSIAVLPFTNMSGDSAQDYFSDGVTEDIISGLARLPWLFVIARDSSFTYKGKVVDVRQVGRELGVRYLLEGSVRKSGERIRITSQLVDAVSGAHIWTDRFEGTLHDIFDLQDQITASVVGAVEPKLRHAEIERARKKPTERLDAYDLFLRALALHNTRKSEDREEALRLLRRAIELDPRYASGYALAANCYFRQVLHDQVSRSDSLIGEGVRLARLAAENGQDDPEALWRAALVVSLLAGDYADGFALIERSLALNPNSADAWRISGLLHANLGDSEVAIGHLQQSVRLNPLDPFLFGTSYGFAIAHFMAGRYGEASTWCDKTLREAANFPPALRMKVALSGLLGQVEEGRKWIQRLLAVNPDASVASLRSFYEIVFKKPGCLDAYSDGLRKAGLPE
jgi:TolB-like protein/Tfp pilus assembly protein PilF